MYKKLIMLIVCGGAPFCYASENRELVVGKNVGVFSVTNKRQPQQACEDRFYHGTVDGGKLCAVYDGYGGSQIAQFLTEKFPVYFAQTSGSIKDRMVKAFKDADSDEIVKNYKESGSTASVVFIKDNVAHFAHVGDSRVLLEADGKIDFVTSDHKPNRADEYVRIEDAHGIVFNERVNGFLAVSRAFGNYGIDATKNIIIVEPEYTEVTLIEKNKFLVLATDGLWDFMSNEEVVKVLQAKKSTVTDVGSFAKLLALFASSRGSRDDITVMVVDLLS